MYAMSKFAKLATHKSTSEDNAHAKKLRHQPTVAEKTLWHQLRLATKERDFHFRRQHPIHPYIVDFVCLQLHLIIEVDGLSHDNRAEYDAQRDLYLKKLGYETMRFSHDDVVSNHEGVIRMIIDRAEKRMTELDIPHP